MRRQVHTFVRRVHREEQPYSRVRAMVDDVLRRQASQEQETTLIGTVQMGQYLRALVLLLRLDLAILSSVIGLKKATVLSTGSAQNMDMADFVVDLSQNRYECEVLAAQAEESKHPREQVEGQLLLARFAALESSVARHSRGQSVPIDQEERIPKSKELRDEGVAHLDTASDICEHHKGTTRGLTKEIEATRKMLQDEFFEEISSKERRQIARAMASDFRGTGTYERPLRALHVANLFLS